MMMINRILHLEERNKLSVLQQNPQLLIQQKRLKRHHYLMEMMIKILVLVKKQTNLQQIKVKRHYLMTMMKIKVLVLVKKLQKNSKLNKHSNLFRSINHQEFKQKINQNRKKLYLVTILMKMKDSIQKRKSNLKDKL